MDEKPSQKTNVPRHAYPKANREVIVRSIRNEKQSLISSSFKDYLLSGDELDFMASFLYAVLGAGDADVGVGIVRSGDGDLGGCFQLQLLQLLPVLSDHKPMMFFRNKHSRRSLGSSALRYNFYQGEKLSE